MRFFLDTGKGRQSSNSNRYDGFQETRVSGEGRPDYDPDMAHPAASYKDAEPAVLPEGISKRKLLTKIDIRVIPCLSVLYLLAFLDRTNIANAAVFGLANDLGLQGNQYNNALVIFFVPYILFEIPSNIILKHLKPHVWLSLCMFGFGLVTICQGLVQNYGGLLTTRFFLGLTETGMFPGAFYLIGMWYKREEAQKRFTFFFASTTLAGAFGGLLASAIGKMDGLQGYLGWRWIFILEGVLTCVISFVWFFIIPDFPEDAKWLTDAEREYIKARLQEDQGKSALERHITLKDVVNCFKDYKIFLGGLMYFGLIVPAYGYAYFAPTIIRSYGYSPIQTQLHSVPPWAAAFGFSMLVATLSDSLRHRFIFTLVPIAISIAGFAILITTNGNRDLQYGALFMVTCGTYAAMPIIVCWYTMNLGGHHRRSVGSGWIIGFGNCGGIIAVYAYLVYNGDTLGAFHRGYSICLGFICLSAASCTAYFLACMFQNRRRETTHDVGITEYEKTEMGDLSPDYRYML